LVQYGPRIGESFKSIESIPFSNPTIICAAKGEVIIEKVQPAVIHTGATRPGIVDNPPDILFAFTEALNNINE
jgi:hypothetical protein